MEPPAHLIWASPARAAEKRPCICGGPAPNTDCVDGLTLPVQHNNNLFTIFYLASSL